MASAPGDLTGSYVPNFIDGAEAPPVNGKWVPKHAPADGNVLCHLARSDRDDVALAVSAARRSQAAWADHTPVARGDIVRRSAELLREHGDELVATVCK
ncbi:MAG: aldehyde dehydrogenase family protein, partial [Actinomycetota bacterium]|nr:aldehyde dehydrogenase family protein [Actinomycetota bacterium]